MKVTDHRSVRVPGTNIDRTCRLSDFHQKIIKSSSPRTTPPSERQCNVSPPGQLRIFFTRARRISSIKGVHHHLTASLHCTESVQRFAPHLCTESWLRSTLYGKVLQKAALWSTPTSTAVAARIPATALGTLKAEHSKFSSEGR